MSEIINSEKVVRKLRYKNPNGSFTEYPIGANSDNIIVGEDNLTATIEQLNTKIDNLDKQESIFLIKLKDIILHPNTRLELFFNVDMFNNLNSINFNEINSSYLIDSHPLSALLSKEIIKFDNGILINIFNNANFEIRYSLQDKLLLYLTCYSDMSESDI